MTGKEPVVRNQGTAQRSESGYNPLVALQTAMHHDFDALVKRFFRDEAWPAFPKLDGWPVPSDIGPKVNVSEKDGVIEVEAQVPGMESKDLDISIMDNVLSLKGEHKEEKEEKGKEFHRKEFSYGRFERSVPLPARVQADKAVASFEKGVLKLTLPVVQEELQRVKKIPIRVG